MSVSTIRSTSARLAVLRLAIGPIVLLHLRPFLSDVLDGVVYSDSFTLPYWSWYPELPEGVYVAMLWGTALTAMLLSIGLWTRLVAWLTVAGVAYNLFLSQTHFHHNRAFLLILLVGLAVLPTGRTVSVDALRARRSGAALSPLGASRLVVDRPAVLDSARLLRQRLQQADRPGVVGWDRDRAFGSNATKTVWPTPVCPTCSSSCCSTPDSRRWRRRRSCSPSCSSRSASSCPVFARRRSGSRFRSTSRSSSTASVQVFSARGVGRPGGVDRPTVARPHRAHRRRVGRGDPWLDWTGRFRIVDTAGPPMVEDRKRRRQGR